MKTVETKLPAGEIIEIKRLFDGTWVIKQKISEENKTTSKKTSSISKNTILGDLKYRCVEAESLSLDDEFMKHKPKTEREQQKLSLKWLSRKKSKTFIAL